MFEGPATACGKPAVVVDLCNVTAFLLEELGPTLVGSATTLISLLDSADDGLVLFRGEVVVRARFGREAS